MGKSLLQSTKADPEKRTWIRERRASQGTHAEENDPNIIQVPHPRNPSTYCNNQDYLPIINPLTPWRPNQTTNNNKAQQSKTLPADFSNYGPVTGIITDPPNNKKRTQTTRHPWLHPVSKTHHAIPHLNRLLAKTVAWVANTTLCHKSITSNRNQPTIHHITTVPYPQIYPQTPKLWSKTHQGFMAQTKTPPKKNLNRYIK